jgi:hypothetical protein
MCAEALVPKLDQGSVATAGHIIYMCGWVGVGVVWDLGGIEEELLLLIVFIHGLYILELLFVSGLGVGWGGGWKWDSEENLHIINYY